MARRSVLFSPGDQPKLMRKAPESGADVVVFDPTETYTISAEDNAGFADFSIYEGREVTGRVEKTFVRGELVADDGEVLGEAGHGEFVERERPDWAF